MTRTPDLPASYQLVRLDSVDSTNEEARRLAASDATVDGTLVWALAQTAGKGRRGRAWDSPAGNLYCSILLRPDCDAANAAQLSFVAAVAVVEAVTDVAGPALEVRCKWPNDVLVGGRKIAGILLESEAGAGGDVVWVAVGVGVNVAHHPDETEAPATSLWAEGLTWVTEADVLEAFARRFQPWKERLLGGGFADVRERWLALAVGVGEPVEVRLEDEVLAGTFAALDDGGALVLQCGDGDRRLITAGDVFFPAD